MKFFFAAIIAAAWFTLTVVQSPWALAIIAATHLPSVRAVDGSAADYMFEIEKLKEEIALRQKKVLSLHEEVAGLLVESPEVEREWTIEAKAPENKSRQQQDSRRPMRTATTMASLRILEPKRYLAMTTDSLETALTAWCNGDTTDDGDISGWDTVAADRVDTPVGINIWHHGT